MSTSKVNVDGDVIPEFDFRRAIPSPFRDRARRGMRFHVVRVGAALPTFHVTARRRGPGWWVEVSEIGGSGRSARWSTIESTARQLIAESADVTSADFDLVIDLPPVK